MAESVAQGEAPDCTPSASAAAPNDSSVGSDPSDPHQPAAEHGLESVMSAADKNDTIPWGGTGASQFQLAHSGQRRKHGEAVNDGVGPHYSELAMRATESIATFPLTAICARPECGSLLALGPRRGSPRRFCSARCRCLAWSAAHPRRFIEAEPGTGTKTPNKAADPPEGSQSLGPPAGAAR